MPFTTNDAKILTSVILNRKMEQKLNNTQIIKLIQIYRSHPLLWDMNSKSYRRNDLKVKAYEEIAVEMGMSADIVKKKIRSLRSTYTAEKKKISKKSGSAVDDVYEPTLFWFHEMSFFDSSISVRKSWDNSEEESVLSTSMDSEAADYSFSESLPARCPRKRKSSPEPNDELDNAVAKLMAITKEVSVFDVFGENVIKQLKDMPEVVAYKVMADMQAMLSERKIEYLKQKTNNIVAVRSFEGIGLETTSTPCTQSSPSKDLLFYAMSDADIIGSDF